MWAGWANALQGLGGISCYVPINFFSFEETGFIGKGKQDMGETSDPTLEHTRVQH